MPLTAILDIDGTLVDTNYHHALAWHRALHSHGHHLQMWKVHRHIGMGGDQIVDAVAGYGVERENGDDIREAEGELYMQLIDEVAPFEAARELIVELKRRGHAVVLSSSAKQDEVDRYLDLLDVREVADGWTTSADVEATKPEPDLVRAALDVAETDDAVMVGDTVWDVKAAARAGIETLAVLTGGFSDAELRDAGALDVFDSVLELRSSLDGTPLA
jgi:HAD superfamily hydrolase (TIGR01509 family)